MMINLPVLQKTFDEATNKIETKRAQLPVEIDTSFCAHLKWEEQFEKSMGCDLSTYTEKVRSWTSDPVKAKSQLIGMLKLLYCYVNSDKLPTFRDFCGLFDYEIAEEIISKISAVLEEVGKSASKN